MKTKGIKNERNEMKSQSIKYIYSNYKLKLTLNKIL